MSKMTHHLKNYQENLNQHQLATPSLRKLLRTIEQPTTPAEKRIMASVARAYERMGDTFPTTELSKKLDALYSQAVSLYDRVWGAMAALVVEHSQLAKKGRSKAFQAEDLTEDVTPALLRCCEVRYLALASASNLINAALKKR